MTRLLRWPRRGWTAVAASVAASWVVAAPAPRDGGLFEFFLPSVTVNHGDVERLDHGGVIARTLPAHDGDVAVFAAVRIAATGDRLVAWMDQVAALEKSRMVEQVSRLSTPPTIDDFRAATLDDDELEGLRSCRVGDCEVKLTAPEIGAIGGAIGDRRGDWKGRTQRAFQGILLARAQAYLAGGDPALAAYADHDARTPFRTTMAALVEDTSCLVDSFPGFAQAVLTYPAGATDDAAGSFLYWSKARLNGKPVITMTHVNVLRTTRYQIGGALIVSEQIFADHYMNGSLGVMTIVGTPGGPHYLAYLNRTNVDVIHGLFGGLTRILIEHHVRNDTGEIVNALKRRIESGPPPQG